ncbi:MAG: stage V sporulation protein AB [Clostridium sp.]|nr:stage V sporulation protein AB [Clostridium sp.]MCM1399270.1 stage V sporulation protein AB [Clostridium sp.]MCM1459758.1 stage V sporulation protein AB [Bacteroides sp.]
MWIKVALFTLFCGFAGGAISAGYVAFITLLGVFEKLTEKYKANKYSYKIETLTIVGVTLGNLIYTFQLSPPLGLAGFLFFTLLGGIFTGCLAGALAETLNVFPILSRRLNIREYLPYVLVAAALGKALGSSIQLLLFE